MDEGQRINAIAAPAPSVLTPGAGFLGVLALDTRFPRLIGDIGNPASFGVPARTRVVRDVRPRDAVQDAVGQGRAGLFRPFRDKLLELEREGATAITTSCGFLVLLQEQLQAIARVPVVTSSLLLLPALLEANAKVGVLTISAEHLGAGYLEAAGVPAGRMQDVIIEGVDPAGAFARTFLGDESTLDFDAGSRDVVEAATRLKERAPQLADVVLECTNMPPYAKRIEHATGLRTWSVLHSPVLMAPFRRGAGGATA